MWQYVQKTDKASRPQPSRASTSTRSEISIYSYRRRLACFGQSHRVSGARIHLYRKLVKPSAFGFRFDHRGMGIPKPARSTYRNVDQQLLI